MTAPTDTPRTNARCKKIRHEALGLGYVADELQHWAEDLERELAAARAEADELARRVGTAEARAKAFMGNLPIYDAALAAAGAIATALRKQGLRICDCGSAPQGICCCGSSSVRAEIEKERGNG